MIKINLDKKHKPYKYISSEPRLETYNKKLFDELLPFIPTDYSKLSSLKNINIFEINYNHIAFSLLVNNKKYFIKVGNYNDQLDEITNEAVISLQLKNEPNFLKILSYTKYKLNFPYSPIKNKIRKLNTVIIYDFLEGIDLKKFIKYSEYDDIFIIIKQIVYSLYEANKKFGFTHYDLHDKNIFILPKNLVTEENIEYEILKKTLITNRKILIIDYGSSYIKNKETGQDFFEGNIKRETFWIHDIVKIMMFIYSNVNYDYMINFLQEKNKEFEYEYSLDMGDVEFLFDEFTKDNSYLQKHKKYLTYLYKEYHTNYDNLENKYKDKDIYLYIDEDESEDLDEYYRGIIKDLYIETSILKLNEKITILKQRKETLDKIKFLIESIMNYFTFIVDGNKATLEDLLYLQTKGKFNFFAVSKQSYTSSNTDNDFLNFINHINTLYK